MRNDLSFWGAMILVLLILAAGAGCEVWRFKECRKVGHGRAYCLLNIR
jgi:hypothetical protein